MSSHLRETAFVLLPGWLKAFLLARVSVHNLLQQSNGWALVWQRERIITSFSICSVGKFQVRFVFDLSQFPDIFFM